MYLLADMSSVCWTCLLAGKDKENGREVMFEDKKVLINSADFGYDNAINHITGAFRKLDVQPKDLVMVFEGKNSKMLRTSLWPQYKASRGQRAPEAYDEFNKLKVMLEATFLGLGARSVTQDNVEGDDIIAYLARELEEEVTILSNDGDMLQLVSDRVHYLREGVLDVNRYGPWPTKYTTLYKALVGDVSDNIKGAHGFGDKAFLDLFCMYDVEGLESMEQLILRHELDNLLEDVADFQKLQKIVDDKDSVYRSYDLARMYPDRVNTMRKPLEIKAGMCVPLASPDERLQQYAGVVRLVTQRNAGNALIWYAEHLRGSPFVALDIETSTPPESDEWLEARKKKESDDVGVDVFGSELTGMSLTFGPNLQYTLYLPFDHVETATDKNLNLFQVEGFVEMIDQAIPIVVHHAPFELSILHRTFGERWKDNGYEGFLPNIEDTKILANYVDENESQGLKQLSARLLNYTQVTYAEVTQGRKMNQMTAAETLSYGADDTICTAALYNHFRFVMSMEYTFGVYEKVEKQAPYLLAQAFNAGTPISLQKMLEMQARDDVKAAAAQAVLDAYLVEKGWSGTVCPQYGPEPMTPAQFKEAYLLVTGTPLDTMVRTPAKLVALVDAAGHNLLACALQEPLVGVVPEARGFNTINRLVKMHFNGAPNINMDSPVQVQRLLYETMGLPIRIRNAPTDVMRANGIREGTPKTDEMALDHALHYDKDIAAVPVLEAIQTLKTVATRTKLYYKPYRFVQHWKDQLVHADVKQCATVTRRGACSSPNLQQLPKRDEGIEFREIIIPHCKDAVIVSFDFAGQELSLAADLSQDENMLSCFRGDNRRSIHSMTGAGIASRQWKRKVSYEEFMAILADKQHPDNDKAKQLRNKEAKVINFADQYDAQSLSISRRLLCTEAEAQEYLDAKAAMFPGVPAWKERVKSEARGSGYSQTMLGARRHLGSLMLGDKWQASKAERQAPNYEIQGSGGEMTKLAMGRVWEGRIVQCYDCRFIAPIHDELVFSVRIRDLMKFIPEVHAMMTQPYANMTLDVESSISFGPSFGKQTEIGSIPDPAIIQAAIDKMFPVGVLALAA